MPRSWAYRHLPDNGPGTAGSASLQLELADPVAYLERHKAALGHNARNVINIAAEVSHDASPSPARERTMCRFEASSTLHQLLTAYALSPTCAGAIPGTCRTPTKPWNQAHRLVYPRYPVFGGYMLQVMCDSWSKTNSGTAGLEGAGCGQRRHVGAVGRWHLHVEAVDCLSGGAVACAGVQVCSMMRVATALQCHCGGSTSISACDVLCPAFERLRCSPGERHSTSPGVAHMLAEE